jgi:hypothetical protein
MAGTPFVRATTVSAADTEGWKKVEFFNRSLCRLNALYGDPLMAAVCGGVVCVDPFEPLGKQSFIDNGWAHRLRKSGFGILLVDLNGLGGSENGNFDYPADIISAGLVLQTILPGYPVALIALGAAASWGVCALASFDHVYETAALDTPLDPSQYWSTRFPGPLAARALTRFGCGICRQLDPYAHIDELRWISSLLFLGSDSDVWRSASTVRKLQQACRIECQVELSANESKVSPHASTLTSGPTTKHERILSFLLTQFSPAHWQVRNIVSA